MYLGYAIKLLLLLLLLLLLRERERESVSEERERERASCCSSNSCGSREKVPCSVHLFQKPHCTTCQLPH